MAENKMIKVFVVSGHHYNETIRIDEVKDTGKNYMLGKVRIPKREPSEYGRIGFKSGSSSWDAPTEIYSLDSEYAQSKYNEKFRKSSQSKCVELLSKKSYSIETINKILELL